MTTPEANSTQSLRPDEDILADIWEAVRQVDTLHSLDMHSLSIEVHAGAVTLKGHLASAIYVLHIEAIAWMAPGVTSVRNDLVADDELKIQVAYALACDERTRAFVLRVGCDHGWVRLGGVVPHREIQAAAEAVAAGVPAVRGVIAVPRVAGEPPAPNRRAVQPRIGASVYGRDGQAGVVAQVVIDPGNRLVTHIAVHADEATDDFKTVAGEYLVPLAAAEVVNVESIFLSRQARPITANPLFVASDYPPAPFTWRPPYPYALGTVRWPGQKAPEPTSNWPTRRQPAHLRAGH